MTIDLGSAFMIGMLGIAGAWIFATFKSPKEYAGDGQRMLAESVSALSLRLTNVETAHANLALKYAESHGRLDESVDNLEKSVTELRGAIDKLTHRIEQFAHTGGKAHARSRRTDPGI